MFSRVRIAIRFFFVGLAVGVLLAPRSGAETRRLLRNRADQALNDLLDSATLGMRDRPSGSAQTGPAPERAGRTDVAHPIEPESDWAEQIAENTESATPWPAGGE